MNINFHNTGRTWWKKGHEPWNKGLKVSLKPKTGKYIICKNCGKKKYFELNQLKRRPCEYCSIKCRGISDRKKELKIYSSIHARIKIDWGKAKVCEFCESKTNIDWANKDHKYTMNKKDWLQLCRKCHIAFDQTRR